MTAERAASLLAGGDAAGAAAVLGPLLQAEPGSAALWTLLGAARHQSGDLAGARAALEAALRIEPDRLDALQALCAVLFAAGDPEQSLAVARRGLARAPRDPVLLTSLGILLEERGEDAPALAAYESALAADPGWLPALMNRGALYSRNGRHLEALADAERLCRMAPEVPEGHGNRATSLLALERFDDALRAAEQALQLRPGWEQARLQRGAALAALGRLDEGAVALANLPQAPDPRVVYLDRGLARQARCDWRERAAFVARFEQLVREGWATGRPLADESLAFPSLALPLPQDTRLALVRGISRAVAQRAAGMGRLETAPAAGTAGRIRLGYLSGNIYRHPTAYLTRFLFRLHDREAFEVHCFSLHPDDGSEVRREIERGVERFHDLAGRDARRVAQAVADAGIAILVDLDGYTRNALPEVPALRPAPVQVAFLGFPGSSGADFIDYALVDAVVAPPGSDEFWSEALVRLADVHFAYDDRQPIDPQPWTRADCGLPPEPFVYCGFNAAYKIEPGTFDTWMRILRRVPDSLLWLMPGDEGAAANLSREAALRGVDPQRLVFAPFLDLPRHLARLRCADLFLDTFVYNAHTTGRDALWAGVPLLSLPGSTWRPAWAPACCARRDCAS